MSQTLTPFSQLLSSSRALSIKVAITETHTVTWEQFTQDVQQVCELLDKQPLQRWAIGFQNSYWFTVAFMAICQSGKQPVLPGNLQPSALAELSHQFDAILHDDAIEDTWFDQHPNHANIALPAAELTSQVTSHHEFQPLTDVLVTLFTSGSSGQPKAIEKPLSILEKEVSQLEATWGDKLQDCVIASTVSHQHIYGLLFRILWPLSTGRAFLECDWQYPEQIMQHADLNLALVSSPALLKRLNEQQKTKCFRALFSSGGPLPHDAAQTCLQLFEQYPHEILGSTETGGIAHRQQLTPQTPWKTFTGTQVGTNSESCLRILSPLVDPDHWYQTADQCQMISDDQFILKGRADRVIKIEEKRISLTEIEKRLNAMGDIQEAAVIPFQDPKRLIVAAVLKLSPQGLQKLDDIGKGQFWLMLRKALHQWIEPVGIPRRFRVVDEIPLNTQGKRLISDIERLFHPESTK
ncbi:AMP-binding protein [Vibrio rumoiensis]|uniref:AMP-fatty acid ligase n=1 Tax=Vibrio rumoiensis 1S-45 TaxID=1188252 RepID=A0A1E5E2T1_9VIBR|nr:AMP-binding protein [Vibrio rumoiensis]OEF25496.1 AMP-fatty acid ligase [Vibrio rumoiensis 1S-45]